MVSNCSQPYQVDHVANDSIDISMSNLNFTLLQVQSLCAFHGKENIYQPVGIAQKSGVGCHWPSPFLILYTHSLAQVTTFYHILNELGFIYSTKMHK